MRAGRRDKGMLQEAKTVKISTLANGIRVITHHMKETEAVALEIWIKVGSRYEKANQGGISHFLEHMAFKGTKTRTARQIAEEFDNIGGNFNAQTSRESTTYYAKVLKGDFERAANILSDIVQNSIFDPKELELERQVILQEISMSNDTPDDIVFDHFQISAYPNQPVGKPILGTVDLVKSFSRQDIIDYVKEYYCGANIVFAVAGNISHAKVLAFAKKKLSKIKKGKASKSKAAKYVGGEKRVKKKLEQTHITMGFEGVSYDNDDIFPLQLLSCILGGGMSSRLFQEIREKRGLAYSISSFFSCYSDTGLFTIYSATSPDKVKQLVTATCAELKKITHDITDEELERAKVQARASLLMSQESTSSRADDLGRRLICFGRYITNREVLKNIEAVDKKSIYKVAKKILASKITIAAIGDIKQLESYEKIEKKLKKA